MALDIYTGKVKTQPKYNPDALQAKGFGPPMIMLNVTSIMRQHDAAKADFYNKNIDMFLSDIDLCIHPECKCCFESVAPDGSRLAGPRGRFVNPGHSIEGAWFMMNEAEYRGDDALMQKALQLLDWSFALGWDDTDKGIQYFADIEGKPISQLEWDMRLWWPHCEALIAMIKAYRITGKQEYLDKFMMVHEYTFSHFKDTEYGEWYGYLRRDGSVNNELKGSLFKGPFHIPRALMEVAAELDKIK
jgi:N-acylglucosamine 2-epimerase